MIEFAQGLFMIGLVIITIGVSAVISLKLMMFIADLGSSKDDLDICKRLDEIAEESSNDHTTVALVQLIKKIKENT